MGPILQQLITLTGVLLGAGATFAATMYVESSKWRRSVEIRWDERRLTAYSDYAYALKTFKEVLFQLAAARGLPNLTAVSGSPVGPNALADAEAERTVKWEKVLLLGSVEAIASARRWHKAAVEFSHFVLGENTDTVEYLRLFDVMGTRRDEFYACARADLGVRDIELPPGEGISLPPHQRHLLSPALPDRGPTSVDGDPACKG